MPLLRSVAARVSRDRVSVVAGSLAFHGFLAFFPAIIAALGVLTIAHLGAGALEHLLHAISKALPPSVAGVFSAAVRAATRRSGESVGAVVVGLVIALWSTSSAMAVLQQAMDVAYEVPVDRTFVSRRVRGVGLMVLGVVLGGAAAALVVLGQPIGTALRGVIHLGGPGFTVAWTIVRWGIAVVLISILFAAYDALAPNHPVVRWRLMSAGSALSTAVFLGASLGFSFYITTFGSYDRTYGSFAGVAIFILWLYLSSFAVLLGAELNATIARARSELTRV